MSVRVDKFIGSAEFIKKSYNVTYRNAYSGYKSGSTYLCDCRGYIMWALRRQGLSISCSGTNWMIRKQMSEVSAVSSADQLTVGQVVFKSRTDRAKLPDKYKRGGSAYDDRFGEIDVYHVGIVTQTSPSLIIRHCTSGGIKTDTKLGAWNWAGWLSSGILDRSNKPTPVAIVTASTGSTVNMRSSPTRTASIIARVPINSTVSVLSEGSGWDAIEYSGKTGYMMTEFLEVRG